MNYIVRTSAPLSLLLATFLSLSACSPPSERDQVPSPGSEGTSCMSDTSCLASLACIPSSSSEKKCTKVVQKEDGKECFSNRECLGKTCLRDARWEGGYCTTLNCKTDSDCSGGSGNLKCFKPRAKKGTSFCSVGCSKKSDCRKDEDYLCDSSSGNKKVCLPKNFNAQVVDIGEGETCFKTEKAQPNNVLFDLPEGTTSFIVNSWTKKEGVLLTTKLTTPKGTELEFYETLTKYLSNVQNERSYYNRSAIQIPSSPQQKKYVVPGKNIFEVTTANDDELCVSIETEEEPGENIDFNVYLVGLDSINAETAPDNKYLKKMFETVNDIYSTQGIYVKNIHYYDVEKSQADKYSVFRWSVKDQGSLVKGIADIVSLSKEPEDNDRLSVNIFLIKNFVPSALLGISSGVPGMAGMHGQAMSGVVFSTEYLENDNYLDDTTGKTLEGSKYTGIIMAHEVGHFLGLAHTSEVNVPQELYDPLDDTPKCSKSTPKNQCPDLGNLMFPIASSRNNELTKDQGFVLKASPLTRGE